MKTITKTTKAIMFALLAMILCVAMAFSLAACNGDNTPPNNGDIGNNNTNDGNTDDGDTETPSAAVITEYDAQFNASIVMGPMGSQSFASVFSAAYVTRSDNGYTLTVIFTAGELNVGGIKGTIFIDNKPTTEETVSGVKDGTIGFYKADGTLVTEGINVTYSSGENYAVNAAQQNVYYVQSVEFPVDGLRDTYDLTLYINSNMMGMQFIKGVHDAKITLDLENGEVVNAITGLGVDTLGTVPPVEQDPEPVVEKYAKYDAQLDGKVAMGQQEINFTETLFDGVYAIKKDDKYEITLIFKTGEVSIFGNKMTAFLTTAETQGYGGTATPVYGYYAGETLVTEGITLTYSSGDNYVTNKNGSYYYVQSMSFVVDELASNYDLSIYVLAGNDSSVSGMQFPYTMSNGNVSKATLTLDLEQSKAVDSIDNLLGVDTLGEVPDPEYQVAIVSLETSAPLPAVKEAFNTAFGESVTLIVTNDGMKLRIENKHMVINLFGNNFDANVAWVQGANVLSTKTEVYSNINGDLTATPTQEEIEVPDVFEIAYPSDCKGVLTLTIGVDFMAKTNSQEIDEYSTNVTLTIDVSSLNLDTVE